MGNGLWSATTYNERAFARKRDGRDAFDYSNAAKQSGQLRVHPTLNPFGLRMRESRDSADHPESNAVIISLDVTGSMSAVVRGIHADLPRLHELLLGHNYLPHPQILFGAVGDATCDYVPLQVGQFESDNRMDQNIENLVLEGGGGGQKTESYELMLYVAARHTSIDCFEKRQRKGYLFMIGDEMAYPVVKAGEVNALIGGGAQVDVPLAQVVAEVKQKYHLYFILPGGAAHGGDADVMNFWRRYVGPQSVIKLDDPADTSECVALAIGINEGAVSLNDAAAALQRRGVVGRTVDRLTRVLGSLVPGGGGPTVTGPGTRRL
jgi:hypothetical protein